MIYLLHYRILYATNKFISLNLYDINISQKYIYRNRNFYNL